MSTTQIVAESIEKETYNGINFTYAKIAKKEGMGSHKCSGYTKNGSSCQSNANYLRKKVDGESKTKGWFCHAHIAHQKKVDATPPEPIYDSTEKKPKYSYWKLNTGQICGNSASWSVKGKGDSTHARCGTHSRGMDRVSIKKDKKSGASKSSETKECKFEGTGIVGVMSLATRKKGDTKDESSSDADSSTHTALMVGTGSRNGTTGPAYAVKVKVTDHTIEHYAIGFTKTQKTITNQLIKGQRLCPASSDVYGYVALLDKEAGSVVQLTEQQARSYAAQKYVEGLSESSLTLLRTLSDSLPIVLCDVGIGEFSDVSKAALLASFGDSTHQFSYMTILLILLHPEIQESEYPWSEPIDLSDMPLFDFDAWDTAKKSRKKEASTYSAAESDDDEEEVIISLSAPAAEKEAEEEKDVVVIAEEEEHEAEEEEPEAEEEEPEPKEGDKKEEDGRTFMFHEGRWRRLKKKS